MRGTPVALTKKAPSKDPACDMVGEGLTPRQRAIFRFIFDWTCDKGYQPSYQEVMSHFRFSSPNAVRIHVKAMERKGWLLSSGNEMRCIRFLRTPSGMPFRGFVERN
jgi:SOS-response transcriptional repressor LexA